MCNGPFGSAVLVDHALQQINFTKQNKSYDHSIVKCQCALTLPNTDQVALPHFFVPDKWSAGFWTEMKKIPLSTNQLLQHDHDKVLGEFRVGRRAMESLVNGYSSHQ